MDIKKIVGRNLLKARKYAQLNQGEVAEKIGVARATYVHYEKGHQPIPIDKAVLVSKLYGITLNSLIDGIEVEIKAADEIIKSRKFQKHIKLAKNHLLEAIEMTNKS